MKYLEEIGNNKNRLFVECFNGYACRFFYQGHDLIHGGSFPEKYRTKEDNLRIEKGAPEYSNITVFPFGGIPEEVYVGRKKIINKDKHGLSRSLPWENISEYFTGEQIVFRQTHDGETSIKNIKYDPFKGNPEFLDSMFPFEILRSYEILNGDIFRSCIKVINPGDFFEYSLWDHPIFISPENLKKGCFYFEDNQKRNKFNLDEVCKSEKNIKFLDGIENISFINYESGVGFNFNTEGFGNLMIWSPEGKGVFSIESKSHPGIEKKFPSVNSRSFSEDSSRTYFMDIEPFLE